MAIALVGIVPRHERRIRLLFSGSLAAGAFTSTAYYAVTCTNSVGTDPVVSAAIQIVGSVTAVDIALASDLAQGGAYSVTCTAVPGSDASTFTGSQSFYFGQSTLRPDSEPARSDVSDLVYGVDLIWDGRDFIEGADGDLATVSGLANAQAAIQRRIRGSGLPWAPDYGPNLDSYVDGPALGQGTARGAIIQQILRDDRVTSAKASVRTDETDPTKVYFDITVKMLGDKRPVTFTHSTSG